MELVKFAESEPQMRVATLIDGGITKRQASIEMGIDERNVYRLVERIKANAVKRGYSPDHDMTHVVPEGYKVCLLYTSPSPRDRTRSRMPSSA